mmetsp:Transcript_2127/g.8270  ORF Transcript_2127/g.8270 Transcript_2127/m.8270 type:complete len:245 (-) Transcript_2127:68-802(-)
MFAGPQRWSGSGKSPRGPTKPDCTHTASRCPEGRSSTRKRKAAGRPRRRGPTQRLRGGGKCNLGPGSNRRRWVKPAALTGFLRPHPGRSRGWKPAGRPSNLQRSSWSIACVASRRPSKSLLRPTHLTTWKSRKPLEAWWLPGSLKRPSGPVRSRRAESRSFESTRVLSGSRGGLECRARALVRSSLRKPSSSTGARARPFQLLRPPVLLHLPACPASSAAQSRLSRGGLSRLAATFEVVCTPPT